MQEDACWEGRLSDRVVLFIRIIIDSDNFTSDITLIVHDDRFFSYHKF